MSDPKNRDSSIAKPAPAEENPSAEGQDKTATPKTDKAKPMAGRVSEAPYSPLDLDPGGHWGD
ncbi:hypothetical protein [Inquilinus sp.]|jgi:hypothetical protein|uniref:hypothetical protein n=1 Tax=Inquilinus sp. TaxID=1932117 RepID=UPI003784599B